MKKISYWAKNNIWKTRILIIASYLILSLLGIIIGKLLSQLDIIISPIIFDYFLAISLLIFVLYPNKKAKYELRKTFDFVLLFTFFLFTVISGNQKKFILNDGSLLASTIISPKDSTKSLNKNEHFISFVNHLNLQKGKLLSASEKKHILKQKVREIKNDKELSKEEKTGLAILCMIAAITLMAGIVAAACSVACAGSGAGGLLILLGGWFLTLFFTARTINYIYKGPRARVLKKRQEAMKKSTDSPS